MNPPMVLRLIFFIFVTSAATQGIELVNRDFTGKRSANTGVGAFLLGYDGRLVVYASSATNIVVPDTNRLNDIFVYDRWLCSNVWNTTHSRWIGTTPLLPEGCQPLQLTADNRYLVFLSSATGFVAELIVRLSPCISAPGAAFLT